MDEGLFRRDWTMPIPLALSKLGKVWVLPGLSSLIYFMGFVLIMGRSD
jgi:hypothetical protein